MNHSRVIRWVVLAGFGIGCDAGRTASVPEAPPPPRFSPQVIDPGAFSGSLGIDNPNNPTNTLALPTFAKKTLAKFTIIGLTHVQFIYDDSVQHPHDEGNRDASGKYNTACYEGVKITYAQTGEFFFGPCLTSPSAIDTLTVYQEVQGTGLAAWLGGMSPLMCGSPPTYCREYSGGKTVLVDPVVVDFNVTATPSTVNYKDSVSVTATITPASAGGKNVPFKVDSTQWAPAFGTQTTPCQSNGFPPPSGGVSTCRKPFSRSGTLTVFATVNGVVAQQALAITVNPPKLTVTASPRSVLSGGSVTFTRTLTTAEFWVPTWAWRPDSGTSGGISSICQWNQGVPGEPCVRTATKSGWMKATGPVGEYTVTDSARVYVIPCPTGDSLVDRESVRKALFDTWSQSHVTDPAPNRRERGAYIYDSLGTDLTVLSQVDAQDTPCRNANPVTKTLPIVTGVHTEPFSPGDTLPWQACGLEEPPAGYYHAKATTWHGPSAPDWIRSWVDQRPNIMIDADSIYRFGPPDSVGTVALPEGGTRDIPLGNWQAKIYAYPKNGGTCNRP